MPLFIECPAGHRLKVPRKRAGHRVVCPVCQRGLLVPAAAPAETAAPEAETPGTSNSDRPSREPVQDAAAAAVSLTRQPSPQEAATVAEAKAPNPNEQAETTLVRPQSEPERQVAVEPRDGSDLVQEQLRTLDNRDSQHASTLPVVDIQLDSGQHWASMVHVQPDLHRARHVSVLSLGVASILVALFCAAPSMRDQVVTRQLGVHAPDVWSYFVLFASTVQIAVAIYAMRIPDWSTSWMATIVSTGCAATYAFGLALTMFADQEHPIVKQLGLLDEAFRWRAQPWCFLVMCVLLILAYCYGRFSVRWYQLERQLASLRR